MPFSGTPALALAATLFPLLLVKRWITRRLQELSIRWTGDLDVALIVFFVLVFPGVIVHEVSHWLAALLLGVRVRKLSIGPVRRGNSRLVSLGSVQVGRVDPVRASLIGMAPLFGGSAVIVLIGTYVLGVNELAGATASGGVESLLAGLDRLFHVPDVWLWLYLIFAVSNVMLPSDSDIAAVRPVLIFAGIVVGAVVFVGGIPNIPEGVVRAVNALAGFLAFAFGLTLAVDGVFVLVIAALQLLTRWLLHP